VAYLGVQPTAGQYRKLDDISGSFNGSTVTFTTQVGGQNVTAGSAQSILVSLGGVIQSPGTNYSVSTNSITFVTAPAAGLSFFAILLGEAVNTGTPSDGTVTPAKLSTGGPSWNSSGNVILQTAGTTAAPALQPTGDTNTGIYFPAADSIGFVEGGAEAARFDSSGRFLVGTSTSRGNGSLLQVVDDASNNPAQFFCSPNNSEGPNVFWLKARGGSTGSPSIVSSGDTLGRMRFSGYDGSTYTEAASIVTQVDGTPGANDMPGRLVFSTTADGASSPTERARITSNGDFLVGATSRTNFEKLGAVQTGNGNAALFSCTDASLTETVLRLNATRNTTNNTYYFLQCYNATAVANRLLIADSGNVTNANNSYTGISDIKLKENIVDANSQWSDIKSLQVRNYNFKEETGQATHRQIGLIAQEVEQICPNLVDESSDRDAEGNDLGTVTKSVNYSVLYMKAVKALQEAMERIEALEAKVAALEAS